MIEVESLLKRFRTRKGWMTAVDQLSFRVPEGEIYALLGPNGAGKTTTLRMLATLTRPDQGRIVIDGIDASKDPVHTREVLAYVPAEAGLPSTVSGREVVSLYARIQGIKAPLEVATEMLERLGAGEYADLPCGELSTGMKRRVVLARSMVHNPRVLLLDEPTDGLDVLGRRDVLKLVRDLASEGRTVIVSSHIMIEVERLAHRIGLMAQGALIAEGTLQEVLTLAGTTNLDDAFVQLVHDASHKP